MKGFDHILNWKLLSGSHEFPSKGGGTSINKAAVVAAGFKYQRVCNVMYMPSCFSRPICHFAMSLKDEDDLERQDLLPYVMRLACADTDEIERERQIYIEGRKCRPMSFATGIAILEGALAIGRQADPLSLAEVQARMSATNQPRVSALARQYRWC
jgi:hypothetical protein